MVDWVRRHQIASFFILTFIISWSIFIGVGILAGLPESPIILLAVFGPMLSAIVLTAVLERGPGVKKLLSRLIQWRVGIRWYLIVIFGSVVLELIAIGLYDLTGGSRPAIIIPSLAVLFGVIIERLLVNILIPGLGEELGWRGFALPRLQARHGALTASLMLGVVWAVWHFPGYWMGTGTHNVPPLLFVLFVVPFTILITWVYNNTNGSVLITLLFHAAFNATLDLLPFRPAESVVPISTDLLRQSGLIDAVYGPYRMTLVVIWVSVVVLLIATKGQLGYVGESLAVD